MKYFKTVEEARATPGIVHIEVTPDEVVGYEAKDALPEHCQPPESDVG